MDKKIFQMILGSASPRRKELMKHTYLNYEVVTSDIEEISTLTPPEEIVQDLALQKARHVFRNATQFACPFVIGADTIVVNNNKILGKPTSVDHAKQMLLELSGKTHSVLTGVAFVWDNMEFSFFDQTEVTFSMISDDLLNFYLTTGESLDKAGSYGIQGAALGFIEKINGSYSNVVGLPVDKVIFHLKNIFGPHESLEGEWRKRFC